MYFFSIANVCFHVVLRMQFFSYRPLTLFERLKLW